MAIDTKQIWRGDSRNSLLAGGCCSRRVLRVLKTLRVVCRFYSPASSRTKVGTA
jgi:hypothetical protein